MMTHSQSAPITVSKDSDTSMSTPIRAQPPIERADDHDQRRPAHPAGLGQLAAARSTAASGGALTDLASRPRWPRRLRPSSGSSAGFCRCRSAPVQHLRRPGTGPRRRRLVRRRPPRPWPRWRRPGRDRADPARRCTEALRKSASDNGLRRRVDQQRVTADRAVSDAGPPQDQQLAVEVIERGVADLGRRRPPTAPSRAAAGRPAARPGTAPPFPPRRSRARPRPPGPLAW